MAAASVTGRPTCWTLRRRARLRSRHGASRHHPLHWLSGYPGYQVVVAVVMKEGDSFPLRDSCNQQVGKADSPDPAAVPQLRLHIKRAMPVFVVGCEPLVACFPVSSDKVKLIAIACRPAQLELDDTARRD
jgi:hypothetical protein